MFSNLTVQFRIIYYGKITMGRRKWKGRFGILKGSVAQCHCALRHLLIAKKGICRHSTFSMFFLKKSPAGMLKFYVMSRDLQRKKHAAILNVFFGNRIEELV